jgi:quercetin dioxygenase-like cupin family protein
VNKANGLRELRQMTNDLPGLQALVLQKSESVIEYECEDGVCIGIGLFKSKDVAIQRTFLSKGAVFPEHKHVNEVEFLLIYTGALEVRKLGKLDHISTVECVKFKKSEMHSLMALENTWMISITIPGSDDYPNAR